MKNHVKAFLVICVFLASFSAFVYSARAFEIGDLSLRISVLQEQIRTLQNQLSQLNATGSQNNVQPYLRMISPNGGEMLILGSSYQIKWEGAGLSTDRSRIQAELYRGESLYRFINLTDFVLASSSGSAYWIPSDLPTDSDYKIQIIDVGANKRDKSDNYFNVMASQILSRCTDTDGGINYNLKGTACEGSKCIVDICGGQNMLVEADCGRNAGVLNSGHDGIGTSNYYCQSGCENGACKTQLLTGSCVDSDQGRDYYNRGTIRFNINGATSELSDFCQIQTSPGSFSYSQSCSGSNCYVAEFFCGTNPDKPQYPYNSLQYQCALGCSNGSCNATSSFSGGASGSFGLVEKTNGLLSDISNALVQLADRIKALFGN